MTQPAPIPRRWQKPTLWAVMGAMAFFVLFYSELPFLFHNLPFPHNRNKVSLEGFRPFALIFIPHILGGLLALVLGPFQFSTRLRSRYLRAHRIIGRIYVYSIFTAAPLGMILSTTHRNTPQRSYFIIAIAVQGSAWIVTTLIAVLAARNRHIQQHREWMIRSYAITFTFVLTRVLQIIPAWNRVTRPGLAMALILFTLMAILIPDIAFSWRHATTRRA